MVLAMNNNIKNNNRKNVNSEIWLCNNETFPSEININQSKQEERRKEKHHKLKFYMIPIITLLIVSIMYGSRIEEYEYRTTINYSVVEGDTLWDISRRYLGKGYKYIQIVIDNDIDNPDLIYAGEEYKVTITHRVRINN